MFNTSGSAQPAAHVYHVEEQKHFLEPYTNNLENPDKGTQEATNPISYPHLILNLDINQTLIVGDSVGGKSPEMAIIDALTDRFIDKWDERLPQPMDYNTFVKEHLYPNPNRDQSIKNLQKEALCSFLTFLKETNHRFYPEAQGLYDQAIASCEKKNTTIFTSFYRLLDHLKTNEISYTLIFRTFGTDTDVVAKELNFLLGNDFLTDLIKYKEKKFIN